MKNKYTITDQAKEDFNNYKPVLVTQPDGKQIIIDRTNLEGFFKQKVTYGNLRYGYPNATITHII